MVLWMRLSEGGRVVEAAEDKEISVHGAHDSIVRPTPFLKTFEYNLQLRSFRLTVEMD